MDNKIAGKPLETLKTMQGGRVEEDGIISRSWASWVSSNIIVILFPAPSKADHMKKKVYTQLDQGDKNFSFHFAPCLSIFLFHRMAIEINRPKPLHTLKNLLSALDVNFLAGFYE